MLRALTRALRLREGPRNILWQTCSLWFIYTFLGLLYLQYKQPMFLISFPRVNPQHNHRDVSLPQGTLLRKLYLKSWNTAFGTKACHLTNDRCVFPSSRTGLRNKCAARRIHANSTGVSLQRTNIHGKSRYSSGRRTQKASVWKGQKKKTWNRTAGAKGAGVDGTSEQPLLRARSQSRGPPYEDWFHETPCARPARLLRTR